MQVCNAYSQKNFNEFRLNGQRYFIDYACASLKYTKRLRALTRLHLMVLTRNSNNRISGIELESILNDDN